jgi:hypothetical protein
VLAVIIMAHLGVLAVLFAPIYALLRRRSPSLMAALLLRRLRDNAARHTSR